MNTLDLHNEDIELLLRECKSFGKYKCKGGRFHVPKVDKEDFWFALTTLKGEVPQEPPTCYNRLLAMAITLDCRRLIEMIYDSRDGLPLYYFMSKREELWEELVESEGQCSLKKVMQILAEIFKRESPYFFDENILGLVLELGSRNHEINHEEIRNALFLKRCISDRESNAKELEKSFLDTSLFAWRTVFLNDDDFPTVYTSQDITECIMYDVLKEHLPESEEGYLDLLSRPVNESNLKDSYGQLYSLRENRKYRMMDGRGFRVVARTSKITPDPVKIQKVLSDRAWRVI